MTWTVIYTRGMVKKMKNKKKMTRHCHVGDSADSMGSGANPKESSFSRVESKFFFYRG